ncbi:hypothetical protein BC835DRAFT_1015050 [Cytidiella melzeri]|nr:hypothetical protein BC835DRAFT_1015050 [Cytidiella melzeri]
MRDLVLTHPCEDERRGSSCKRTEPSVCGIRPRGSTPCRPNPGLQCNRASILIKTYNMLETRPTRFGITQTDATAVLTTNDKVVAPTQSVDRSAQRLSHDLDTLNSGRAALGSTCIAMNLAESSYTLMRGVSLIYKAGWHNRQPVTGDGIEWHA